MVSPVEEAANLLYHGSDCTSLTRRTIMATAEALLTAEAYRLLPDNGQPTELVRGRVVPMNMPGFRHGEVCAQVAYLLRRFLEEKPLGRVVTNDSGVLTERNPDTVRGADVSFYSYTRLPREQHPEGYPPAPPELIFEVRSPGDRWPEVLVKVTEYLRAGVHTVCVLDPQTETAHLHHTEHAPQILTAEQEFALPDLLGDFRVPVRRYFE
jgi:Uma2 family endonuclease